MEGYEEAVEDLIELQHVDRVVVAAKPSRIVRLIRVLPGLRDRAVVDDRRRVDVIPERAVLMHVLQDRIERHRPESACAAGLSSEAAHSSRSEANGVGKESRAHLWISIFSRVCRGISHTNERSICPVRASVPRLKGTSCQGLIRSPS